MNISHLSMFLCRSVYAFATFVVLSALAISGSSTAQAGECPALLHHSFTGQYGGLEALYRKYRERGLMLLGVPYNDFAGQEPGSNSQIANFFGLTYDVECPMFAKSHVMGERRNAFLADLAQHTGEVPRWNYHNYRIERDGSRVLSFGSEVMPEDMRLTQALFRLLDARKNLKRTT